MNMSSIRKELWSEADVQCPFFVSHDNTLRVISCEGYRTGIIVSSKFRSIYKKNMHLGEYCAGVYDRCPMYKFVCAEKYHD